MQENHLPGRRQEVQVPALDQKSVQATRKPRQSDQAVEQRKGRGKDKRQRADLVAHQAERAEGVGSQNEEPNHR